MGARFASSFGGVTPWLATVAALASFATLAACGGSDAEPTSGGSIDSVPTVVTEVPAPDSIPADTVPAGTDAPAATAPAAPAGGYQLDNDRSFPTLADGKTDPVVTPLPDGDYWSWEYTSDGTTVQFTLSQRFTGDACREKFGPSEDACASDNETLYEPSANVTMPAGQGTASVVVLADNEIESYRVSPAEFARLTAGMDPAADAPSGFRYERYGALVTVSDGQVVSVDQIFMS